MFSPHLIHITRGVFCNYRVKYHLYFGGCFELPQFKANQSEERTECGSRSRPESKIKDLCCLYRDTQEAPLRPPVLQCTLLESRESAVLWHCSRGDQDRRQEEGGNKINPNKIYLQPQERCRGYRPGLGLCAVVLP